MKAFTIKKKHIFKTSYIGIIVFIAVICVFLSAINYTADAATTRNEQALRNAISKDIVHCYAQNGYYPPSLDYIQKKYGLKYNTDEFFIDYQPTGSNMYPSVTIIRKEVPKYAYLH